MNKVVDKEAGIYQFCYWKFIRRAEAKGVIYF